MTGFLDMAKSSGRTLTGDVIVSRSIQGLPAYEQLIDRVLETGAAEAGAPLVETFGLLKMPYPFGEEKSIQTVNVWAIDPVRYSKVTNFDKTIYWKTPTLSADQAALAPDDPRRFLPPDLAERTAAMTGANGRPGAILGIHVSIGNTRERDGSYRFIEPWWMPMHEVTLTLAPVSSRGRIGETRDLVLPVVNEFSSGVYQFDKNRIMIPLAEGQRLLRLNEQPIYDRDAEPGPDGSLPLIGTAPARATHILFRAAEGVSAEALREVVRLEYERLERERSSLPEALGRLPPRALVGIFTWEQQIAELTGPVEKEREMMRILFSIIYLVCAGLVLSIFWAIVAEKTRDIGILRAVGAGRWGVLSIFLQYGVVIGVVGSALGVALAHLVVTNINSIHNALGDPAPPWSWMAAIVLTALLLNGALWATIVRDSLLWALVWCVGALAMGGIAYALHEHTGWLMWDPRVYYFTRIPSTTDWFTAAITVGGAIVFSVLGASVPAAKAADIDPVRALRYE
ncbi:MAG: ABC transporter permease [Phycisphaerae bacterium]|nr:ABC transporter permease [Phycisphaerae bacterium]